MTSAGIGGSTKIVTNAHVVLTVRRGTLRPVHVYGIREGLKAISIAENVNEHDDFPAVVLSVAGASTRRESVPAQRGRSKRRDRPPNGHLRIAVNASDHCLVWHTIGGCQDHINFRTSLYAPFAPQKGGIGPGVAGCTPGPTSPNGEMVEISRALFKWSHSPNFVTKAADPSFLITWLL